MKFTVTMSATVEAADAGAALAAADKLFPGCDVQAVEPDEENPRERGDDDGAEYADPADEMERRMLS